jgi:hypothetical protein
MRIPVFLSAVLLSTGCAALKPRPTQFTSFGEADPVRDRSVLDRVDALDETREQRPEVKVLVDTLPDGIELSDNTLKLVDGAPYELVGKFVLGNRLDFFPDYKDGWRKGLCYPQLPLVVISIFTWAVVPTYWPCIPSYGMTRAEAIDTAKTLAWSAGANLVLLTYRGADAGEQIGGGQGFLIKTDLATLELKKAKPRPAPSATSASAGRPDAPGDVTSL